MKIKLIPALLLLFILGSCKIDKKEENQEALPQTESPKLLNSKVKLTFDMVVPKDDLFQVYYTEDGTANCSDDQSVKTLVKGSDVSQKIVFYFPEDVAITYLRFDPGENKDQGTMKANSFTYEYFGKKIEASGSDFFNYFGSPTEQITVDTKTGTITPSGKGEKYDPVLYQQPQVYDRLVEILKQ
jgi:hypothetical protein